MTKGAGSRAKVLTMAFKLLMLTQESWRELNGAHLLPVVRTGVRFVDGVQIERGTDEEDLHAEGRSGARRGARRAPGDHARGRDGARPLFHRLIRRFGELAGVPVLLNASFNVQGEPIVEPPLDAVRCFYSTGLDALGIRGGYLLRKV